MFIAARGMHQITQSPRGATGGNYLNHGLGGFSGLHGLKNHDATARLNS